MSLIWLFDSMHEVVIRIVDTELCETNDLPWCQRGPTDVLTKSDHLHREVETQLVYFVHSQRLVSSDDVLQCWQEPIVHTELPRDVKAGHAVLVLQILERLLPQTRELPQRSELEDGEPRVGDAADGGVVARSKPKSRQ